MRPHEINLKGSSPAAVIQYAPPCDPPIKSRTSRPGTAAAVAVAEGGRGWLAGSATLSRTNVPADARPREFIDTVVGCVPNEMSAALIKFTGIESGDIMTLRATLGKHKYVVCKQRVKEIISDNKFDAPVRGKARTIFKFEIYINENDLK